MMLKFTSEGPSVTPTPRNRKRVLAAARRVGARGAEETFEFAHRGLPAGEATPETDSAFDFARRHWMISADARACWRSGLVARASPAGLATGGRMPAATRPRWDGCWPWRSSSPGSATRNGGPSPPGRHARQRDGEPDGTSR